MYRPMCWAILFAKGNFIENENKITADAPEIGSGHGGKVHFSKHGLIFMDMQVQ